VTQDDVAKSKLVTRAGLWQAWLATAWCGAGLGLGLLVGVVSVGEIAAGLLAVTAVTLWLGWRFIRRVGGLTGDFLGAAEQSAEVAFLLGVAFVRGGGGA
jgi:adenosylcobinamide-GDP ribazoletransferase